MTVKRHLYLSGMLVLLLLASLMAAGFLISNMIQEREKRDRLVGNVSEALSDLNYLMSEYILFHGERMELQWRSKFAHTDDQIAQLRTWISKSEPLLNEIVSNFNAMGSLFSRFVKLHKDQELYPTRKLSSEQMRDARTLQNRLVTQLLIKSQGIRNDIFLLANEVHSYLYGLQTVVLKIFSSFPIVLFVFSAIVIFLHAMVIRHVHRRINELTDEMRSVGEGELGHTVAVRGADEFGQLAAAFNKMTENLKRTTVSRNELAVEVEERRRAETALKESESRFRALFEHHPLPIWVYDRNTLQYLEVNNAAVEKYGYSREEYLKMTLLDLRPPEEIPRLLQYLNRPGLPRVIKAGEWRHRKKDGEIIINEINAYQMDLGGKNVMLAVGNDITRRKLSEQKLRESEERFRQLSNAAFEGIVIHSPGKIIEVNHALLRMLGYSDPSEVIGRTPMDFISPVYVRRIRRKIRKIHQTPYEMEMLKKDGTPITVEACGKAIQYQGRKARVAALRDITERKRAEENLKTIAAELARSNKELEQFAYVASHDLQEPLRMVSCYIDLLAKRYKGKLSVDADEYIQYAVSGAKRMQRLIGDLLAYSRVGRAKKSLETVDCTKVVEQVIHNLKIAVEESGARITHIRLPSLRMDRVELVQLFQNLISNALKFRSTAPPHIEISAERVGDAWQFCVRDNGIGLEMEFAERIFLIFQRLHVSSEYPGTGVGLAICKKIVEQHGGQIWVQSKRGEGSAFYFTLAVTDNRRLITSSPLAHLTSAESA